MSNLDAFVENLHSSATLLSMGVAEVMGHTTPAALVRNLYGQEIVWGMFSVEKGKFKGKFSNNAATEDVKYYSNAIQLNKLNEQSTITSFENDFLNCHEL